MTSRGFRIGGFPTLAHRDRLNPYELGFELGFSVLEEKGYDFLQVPLELVQRLGLTVRTREPRHEADVEAGFRIAFNDSCKRAHRCAPRKRATDRIARPRIADKQMAAFVTVFPALT